MNEVAKIKTEDAAPMLPADPMISMIERIAMDPNSDLAKLERMLELKEKHEASEAKAAFAAAFAKASAEFPTIPQKGKGHNNKAYATLKDIINYTRPVLSENGLALTFSIEVNDSVIVTAELMHKAGHSKSTSITLPRENSGSKNAVQAVGSSQTYGQRYTAQAILGLSLGDDTEDDGRGAGGNSNTVTPQQFIALRDLVEQSGADLAKFLLAYRAASLEEFPAASFTRAKQQLERKMEQEQ